MAVPGSNIRLLREEMRLSQRSLAKAVGMDVAALSRLEAGKSASRPDIIKRIADALNVTVGVLYAEPAAVEAAALRTRKVPVLTPEQLAIWSGPNSVEFVSKPRVVDVELRRVSRYGFALTVTDEANKPEFRIGDDLVFDPRKLPEMGKMVVAQEKNKRTYIGRYRPMPRGPNDQPAFEVVPYDALFPIGSSNTSPDIQLRGTLVDLHRHFD